MVQYRANGPQQYTRIPKEAIMEAIKLKISKAKELIIREVKAKLKILIKEDV